MSYRVDEFTIQLLLLLLQLAHHQHKDSGRGLSLLILLLLLLLLLLTIVFQGPYSPKWFSVGLCNIEIKYFYNTCQYTKYINKNKII